LARFVYLLVALGAPRRCRLRFPRCKRGELAGLRDEGAPACSRQDLAFGQFILAVIGFVPALVLLIAAALRKKTLAALAVAVGGRSTSLGPFCSMRLCMDGMT
jgi:hypothetical protein